MDQNGSGFASLARRHSRSDCRARSRAVVRTASGRFRWVDDDAVLLGEMLPTDQMPAFFLRGLNEDDPDGARKENRERVAKFLELQHDWDVAGLSERVSEVNVMDIRDIRAQLADDNSQIEVRLGSRDHGKRLKDALEVLDAQKQSPHGSLISYIDLSQGKRAIVGLTSGAHASDAALPSNLPADATGTDIPERNPVGPTQRNQASADEAKLVATRTRQERSDRSAAQKKSDAAKKSERRSQ